MAIKREDLLQLESGWPTDQIVEVDAAAVQQLPALRALQDQGYEFRWVQIARVRSLTQSGWELACDVQDSGRILYMNHVKTSLKGTQDLVLIMRNPAETVAIPALLRNQEL